MAALLFVLFNKNNIISLFIRKCKNPNKYSVFALKVGAKLRSLTSKNDKEVR